MLQYGHTYSFLTKYCVHYIQQDLFDSQTKIA